MFAASAFRPSSGKIPAIASATLWLSFCALASPSFRVEAGSPERPAQAPASGEATLEGRICDAAGEALGGVSIQLAKDSNQVVATTRTDAAGNYRFSGLSPGSYRLLMTHEGFRPLERSTLLANTAETKRLDAVLERTPGSNSVQPEFSDSPTFTVAGVADFSNVGLHGSDANVRTSDSLAKATAALKDTSGEASSVTPGAGDAHRRIGEEKEKSGDPLGAEKEFEAAVKADPSEQNYFAWGAELLIHRAGRAAAEVFATGARFHPKSARMRAGLAAAYYAEGRYEEAAAKLCEASDLDPAASEAYLFLAKMEKASTDLLPCSDERFSRLLIERPDNAQANFYYGLVLFKKARKAQSAADFARAEQLFQKAIVLDPNLAEVYLYLGMLYNARGEKDAATAAFQRAAAIAPTFGAAHYQLSLAYRRVGESERADAEMKRYDELRRSEDAELEKERRELRQFVTILQDGKSKRP